MISDANDGKVRQDVELCEDSDDLFLDAKRRFIYVSCVGGDIEAFAVSNKGYQAAARIKTRAGARTSLFVPELDRLYVAAPGRDGKSAVILVFQPN